MLDCGLIGLCIVSPDTVGGLAGDEAGDRFLVGGTTVPVIELRPHRGSPPPTVGRSACAGSPSRRRSRNHCSGSLASAYLTIFSSIAIVVQTRRSPEPIFNGLGHS